MNYEKQKQKVLDLLELTNNELLKKEIRKLIKLIDESKKEISKG